MDFACFPVGALCSVGGRDFWVVVVIETIALL